jgi:hypothetical protein
MRGTEAVSEGTLSRGQTYWYSCSKCGRPCETCSAHPAEDRNGHRINAQGKLVFDERCHGCDAPSHCDCICHTPPADPLGSRTCCPCHEQPAPRLSREEREEIRGRYELSQAISLFGALLVADNLPADVIFFRLGYSDPNVLLWNLKTKQTQPVYWQEFQEHFRLISAGDIPALLTALDAAEKENERLRAALEDARYEMDFAPPGEGPKNAYRIINEALSPSAE